MPLLQVPFVHWLSERHALPVAIFGTHWPVMSQNALNVHCEVEPTVQLVPHAEALAQA